MCNKEVALVVGGSGGIGIAITKKLALEKINVFSSYNKNNKNIEKLLRENESANIFPLHLNILDRNSVKKALEKIQDKKEKIDFVIYSISAPLAHKKFLELSWEEFKIHQDIQVRGIYYLIKEIEDLKLNKESIKFIVILTKACVGKPPSNLSHYITSKYSLLGFCKSMSVELSKKGYTFIMASPNLVETDLLINFPKKLLELEAYKSKLGRNTSPQEIASSIFLLIRNKSEELNGMNVLLNGNELTYNA